MNATALAEPRITSGKTLLIAGFRQTHRASRTDREIPRQWRRLWPYLGSLKNQIGKVTYGVVCADDDDAPTDYMCAIEVDGFADLPPELDCMEIPPRIYAVFAHTGNMTALRTTRQSIRNEWYPRSGYRAVDDVPGFERYGEDFDPASGEGDMEVWFPIRP